MSGSPDPKPRKREKAKRGEWSAIVRRAVMRYRECEAGCGRPAATGHHFVARGDGGDDVAENCVVLCGHGTQGCHCAAEGQVSVTDGERVTPEQVRGALRERVEEVRLDVRDYALERKGEAWLDRRYPRQSEEEQDAGQS